VATAVAAARLAEARQRDRADQREHEAGGREPGHTRPRRVTQQQDADDRRRDGLDQDHRCRRHGDASAVQRRGVEHERDDARGDQRVRRGRSDQLVRREPGQNPGADGDRAVAKPGQRPERRRPGAARQPRRCHSGQRDRGQRRDQGEMEVGADRCGALAARRRAEQADSHHHRGHRQPLTGGQHGVHKPGREHCGHGQVGGDDDLDLEQGQPPERDELADEAEQVDGETGGEQPLPQHPDDQAGIDTAGPVEPAGHEAARRRPDGDRLHHRGEAVTQRGDQGRGQAHEHRTTLRRPSRPRSGKIRAAGARDEHQTMNPKDIPRGRGKSFAIMKGHPRAGVGLR